MTPQEFTTQLDGAYSSPLPPTQSRIIREMVQEQVPEHGIRHFLDFVLKMSERRPNAGTVRNLLMDYLRQSDPTPAEQEAEVQCKYGKCDGHGFYSVVRSANGGWRRPTCWRELYETSALDRASVMCRCHAGYSAEW